jgi:hypothetical protein
MRRSIMLLAFVTFAAPAQADLFSCSEAGLDSAIAAAQGGDSGPHELDCLPGAMFQIIRGRIIRADLTLDGRGVTIECTGTSFPPDPIPRCFPVFRVVSGVSCRPPTCSPPVYEPPPNVTLENIKVIESDLRRGSGI